MYLKLYSLKPLWQVCNILFEGGYQWYLVCNYANVMGEALVLEFLDSAVCLKPPFPWCCSGSLHLLGFCRQTLFSTLLNYQALLFLGTQFCPSLAVDLLLALQLICQLPGWAFFFIVCLDLNLLLTISNIACSFWFCIHLFHLCYMFVWTIVPLFPANSWCFVPLCWSFTVHGICLQSKLSCLSAGVPAVGIICNVWQCLWDILSLWPPLLLPWLPLLLLTLLSVSECLKWDHLFLYCSVCLAWGFFPFM